MVGQVGRRQQHHRLGLPVKAKAYDANAAQHDRDDEQHHVDGGDQPEGEQVQGFVAVLAERRVVVRLVDLVDPERTDDEPPEHEAVDERLRWRLPQPLQLLLLPAADARG